MAESCRVLIIFQDKPLRLALHQSFSRFGLLRLDLLWFRPNEKQRFARKASCAAIIAAHHKTRWLPSACWMCRRNGILLVSSCLEQLWMTFPCIQFQHKFLYWTSNNYFISFSLRAASSAKYVQIPSAPARRQHIKDSRITLSDNQPFWIAPASIAYSPLTL